MIVRLHHIGVVCQSIAETRRIFEDLGFCEVTDPEPDPVQKVVASFINVLRGQDIYIELLEPTDKTSPIANFLKRRGGGLHHLCFEVENIEPVAEELVRRGYRMVSPPIDCVGYDRSFKRQRCQSSKIAFFWLFNKVLIELLQQG